MTNAAPLVTIVTAVFNGARHLEATIASIRAQTMSDFEYLIVDDCSTDETAKIIAAATAQDARIRGLSTTANSGGPATPRNIGVAAAQGRWVAFCDADDIWLPEKLARQLDVAAKTPGAFYCTAIRDFMDGTEPMLPQQPVAEVGVESLSLGRMLVKNRVALSSVLMSTERMAALGPFNDHKSFVAVEDYDMWLRALGATGEPAIRLDETLVLYRRVASSISSGKLKMLRKAMMVQAGHFERQGQATWFNLTRPLRMLRYVIAAIWQRRIRGEL